MQEEITMVYIGVTNQNKCTRMDGDRIANQYPDGSDELMKLRSHGTHVGGTIAGDGRLMGVAPKAQILSYDICFLKNGKVTWRWDDMISVRCTLCFCFFALLYLRIYEENS